MSTMKNHDRVDDLLTKFYRSELPTKWPAAPRPGETTLRELAVAKGDRGFSSRWALVASVAMVLGGCWFLTNNMSDGKAKRGFDLENGSASPKVVKDLGKTTSK